MNVKSSLISLALIGVVILSGCTDAKEKLTTLGEHTQSAAAKAQSTAENVGGAVKEPLTNLGEATISAGDKTANVLTKVGEHTEVGLAKANEFFTGVGNLVIEATTENPSPPDASSTGNTPAKAQVYEMKRD